MRRALIIWPCSLAIAFFAASHALENVVTRQNPSLAINLLPANGMVQASYSNSIYAETAAKVAKVAEDMDPSKGSAAPSLPALPPEAKNLALRGYALEPTATKALLTLALGAQGEGDEDKARALMEDVTELTRREPVANLAMSSALFKSNPTEALRFLDITMRTSPSATNVLLPRMVSLLRDDGLVNAYAVLLSKNPPWQNGFWYLAFRTPGISSQVGALRIELTKYKGYIAPENVDEGVLKQLVANGEPDIAYRLYQALGGPRENIPDMAAGKVQRKRFAPLDWQYFSTGEFGSQALDNGQLSISALSNTPRSVVANRLVRLSPGHYNLVYHLSRNGFAGYDISSRIYCGDQGNPKENKALSRVKLSAGETKQKLDATSSCHYYWIEISVSTEASADPIGGTIEDIELLPATV